MNEKDILESVLLTGGNGSSEVKLGDEVCLIVFGDKDEDSRGVVNKAINMTGEGPYKILKIRRENGECYLTYKPNIGNLDGYELSSKFFRKFNGSCV